MNRILTLFIALLSGTLFASAITFDADTYYYVTFLEGGNVLTAQGNSSKAKTSSPDSQDAQLWKIEGSASTGYTFTSRSGQKLYTSTTAKNGMFYTSSAPSSNTRFTITACTLSGYTEGFTIAPKGTSVYMNQWGGAGTGKELGLWDSVDANCPVKFVSEAEYEAQTTAPLAIIPLPQKVTMGTGTLNPEGVSINYTTNASLAKEAYTLTVASDGITITSSEDAGKFYGEQTLAQLTMIYGNAIPCCVIEDSPRFAYRGAMLDIARHFFTKDMVKRLLDAMAFYKFSIFHWHLTDDQGWRIEIPEYPKLTTVGAIRAGSLTSLSGYKDDTEYGRGCYYTLDDLREIVEYASARHIEIIPEYDLPGHNVAAVASYPELLSCDPTKTYEVRINSGISTDVLNVGKQETMDFLKCVLGHLAEVFPSQYIHLGGDECPTTVWESCAEVQQLIKDKGLSGVSAVQPWLLEELGTWLYDNYGKTVICWDELLANWPSTNTIKPVIMAWNSAQKCNAAANNGMKSICVPYNPCYLDFMQASPDDTEFDAPYYGGWSENNYNTLPALYALNPTGTMSAAQANMVIGTQGNLWTETCDSEAAMQYCYFPRLLAIAENGWTDNGQKNWKNFHGRLQYHKAILDAKGIYYGKQYFDTPETSELEAAQNEAKRLLDGTRPDAVGYVSTSTYEALSDALEASRNEKTDESTRLADLNAQLTAYKTAPITKPEAGRTYRIYSASSYYKTRYTGGCVNYVSASSTRLHYTPQQTDTELWIPVYTSAGNLTFVNGSSASVKLKINGAYTLKMQACTTSNGVYDYIPGVVTISNLSASKFLYANTDGSIAWSTDAILQKPASWYLEDCGEDPNGIETPRIENVTNSGTYFQVNPFIYIQNGRKYIKH